jgi:hypothetical protein
MEVGCETVGVLVLGVDAGVPVAGVVVDWSGGEGVCVGGVLEVVDGVVVEIGVLVLGGGGVCSERARGDADRVGGVEEMPVIEDEWGSGMRLLGAWVETKVGREVSELDMWEIGDGWCICCGEVWITGGEEDRVDVASKWFWKGLGLWLCPVVELESMDMWPRASARSKVGSGRLPVLVRGRFAGGGL